MRSEKPGDRWPTVRVRDVAEINPESTRGLGDDRLIRYIDISSVDSSYRIADNLPELPLGEAPSRAKRLVREGDILFSTVRSERRSFAVVPNSYDQQVASTGFAVIRPTDSIDPGYLWAAIRAPSFVAHIVSRQRGSNYPAVGSGDVADASLLLPPIDQQQQIARVLGSLDRKIENNRQLAGTLEETASALFKARFADHAGYDEASIYELAEVTYGRPFKSGLFDEVEGTPLIRIRDLAGNAPKVRTPEIRDDARIVTAEDIVVGMDGEFRAHVWSGPDSWLNQRVCLFDPRENVSRVFVLEAIKKPLAFFEATKSGTTVIHLGKADIDTFRVVMPPSSVMREFAQQADPLLEAAVAHRVEARTLTALRDILLPRLISGSLRVQPRV